jgi:hypothetical protein
MNVDQAMKRIRNLLMCVDAAQHSLVEVLTQWHAAMSCSCVCRCFLNTATEDSLWQRSARRVPRGVRNFLSPDGAPRFGHFCQDG